MGSASERDDMTRVLLTGIGPEHRYVANRLVESGGVDLVLAEHGRSLNRRERVRQLRRRYSPSQLGSRAALSLYRLAVRDATARRGALSRVLGTSADGFARPELVREVESVNDTESRQLVAGLTDVRILVYGTGIVGNGMLTSGTRTPLNMHTGISPRYRGSSCAFWPVHNGELEYVGATVHEVTKELDGGRIFGVTQARLEPDDQLHEIFGRAVVAGTDLYLRVLDRIDDPEYEAGAEVQNLGLGVEYRAVMRDVRAERRVRLAIQQGAVRSYCEQRNDGSEQRPSKEAEQ